MLLSPTPWALDAYTGDFYCWVSTPSPVLNKVARGEMKSPDNHFPVSSGWICAATKGSGITPWGDGRGCSAQWALQGGGRPRAVRPE